MSSQGTDTGLAPDSYPDTNVHEESSGWLERMTKTMAHVGGRLFEAALPLTFSGTALGVTGIIVGIMFNGGMINPVFIYSAAAAATATFCGLIYNSIIYRAREKRNKTIG